MFLQSGEGGRLFGFVWRCAHPAFWQMNILLVQCKQNICKSYYIFRTHRQAHLFSFFLFFYFFFFLFKALSLSKLKHTSFPEMQTGIVFPAAFSFAQENTSRCDCKNWVLIVVQLRFRASREPLKNGWKQKPSSWPLNPLVHGWRTTKAPIKISCT